MVEFKTKGGYIETPSRRWGAEVSTGKKEVHYLILISNIFLKLLQAIYRLLKAATNFFSSFLFAFSENFCRRLFFGMLLTPSYIFPCPFLLRLSISKTRKKNIAQDLRVTPLIGTGNAQ